MFTKVIIDRKIKVKTATIKIKIKTDLTDNFEPEYLNSNKAILNF